MVCVIIKEYRIALNTDVFSFFCSGTVIAVVESSQLQLITVNVGLELPLMQNLEVVFISITKVFSEFS